MESFLSMLAGWFMGLWTWLVELNGMLQVVLVLLCVVASGVCAINGGGPMMHLILVIAVVIILAASCLLTFALCRAATRRDMLEARWREESAGSVSEESHESA